LEIDIEAIFEEKGKAVAAQLEHLPRGAMGEAIQYAMRGGKRLRPVLAIMCCEAAGGDAETALPFAVSVEAAHNFTLIHDDILDRSAERRGAESVPARYGINEALVVGDALAAWAFEHSPLSHDLAGAVYDVCEGQLLDLAYSERNPTEREYMVMIELKTARLFELAARGGALLGGAPSSTVHNIAGYGRSLGMAYQLYDDLRDLTEGGGGDIREGKRTLPVIYALSHAAPTHREALMAMLEGGRVDLDQVREIMRATRSLEYTREKVDAFAERAQSLLACLPPSEGKDILAALPPYMLRTQ